MGKANEDNELWLVNSDDDYTQPPKRNIKRIHDKCWKEHRDTKSWEKERNEKKDKREKVAVRKIYTKYASNLDYVVYCR